MKNEMYHIIQVFTSEGVGIILDVGVFVVGEFVWAVWFQLKWGGLVCSYWLKKWLGTN